MSDSKPTRQPEKGMLSAMKMVTAGESKPTLPLLGTQTAPSVQKATAPTAPLPPAATGATAWQDNQAISGLWSIAENRNSWVGVTNVGWVKLANNSDTAIVALTMLAAHAREFSRPVNYRQENDGMIHEMYVW
jgi:hypothetical protein